MLGVSDEKGALPDGFPDITHINRLLICHGRDGQGCGRLALCATAIAGGKRIAKAPRHRAESLDVAIDLSPNGARQKPAPFAGSDDDRGYRLEKIAALDRQFMDRGGRPV